ncbi:hypothetical protein JCM10908_005373 [Rhodotorula pacifica]|uniref:E3 ubiquitin-protein ligase n=1 Tax=Rhodotorula pacifica TaxID=1495444 RepID=UPI00317B847B
MSSSHAPEGAARANEGGDSFSPRLPLFRAVTPLPQSPTASDQQQSSQNTQHSSIASSVTMSDWILPKPGSHRRAVYDSVISVIPEVSPPYLLQRMSVHKDNAGAVIEELFSGGYPLAGGGFQVKAEVPAEEEAAEEDSEQHSRMKHHVECQCCLESVPLSQVGHCDSGHPFCSMCLSKRTSDAIASKKPDLACFAIGTACTAAFSPIELKRAVPRPMLDKLDDLQIQIDLDRAGVPGLEKCPFCPFAAVLEETDIRFPCQGCGIVSCRRCRQKEHGSQPCPVLPRTEGEVLHQIEEAMSEAIIRKCPSCGVACTKTEGCNKMTCGPCGARFCYVCGERTERTSHWNESAAADTRCPANDDSEKRSFVEAQKARKRKIAELESYGIAVPKVAKADKFGPSRPKRTQAEEAALYQNGRHVFRSQDSSFEQVPERDLRRDRYGVYTGAGYARSDAFAGNTPPPPPPLRALPIGQPLPPWYSFDNFGILPTLPPYGYAVAGSGIFGGGAPGGGASGSGSWNGGKGAATRSNAAALQGGASESEPPTPPQEAEEVRRQKMLNAVLKRQSGGTRSR